MNEKNRNNFYASDNSNQPFDPGTFGQEEKIRNLGKIFKDEAGEYIDADDKNKKSIETKEAGKNNYDELVPKEEIAGFKEEIEKKIEEKAKELKISREKLIELAELDLESLGKERLESLNLNRGGLEFIRDSIDRSINEFSKSGKPNVLLKESPSQLIEFIKEHKGKISLVQLGLYLSAFGSPALKELAGDHAIVDIHGEKISLEDLAKNPELLKELDRAHSSNSPVDIKAVYEPLGKFESGIAEFSFHTNEKMKDSKVEKFISFGVIGGPDEGINNMKKELKSIGISLQGAKECPMDDFINKKDQIADIMSKNLGVPKEEIDKYLNEFIEPSVSISNISIVSFEDFKVNQELKNPEDLLILKQKKAEVYEKYNVDNEKGRDPESWLKAEKELEQWYKENGDKNKSFDKALAEEKENFDNSPEAKLKHLKYQEEKTETYNNSQKFKELALKSLNDAGYSIPELKKIAEKHPEKVIKIMSDVINKNADYDLLEYLNIEINGIIEKLLGENFKIKYFEYERETKEGIPGELLQDHKGVCHDYGITLVAMKHILEKEGVPNLDKFASFWTTSDKQNHLWTGFVTVDSEGKLTISYADPTWSDTNKKAFDAINKDHYYTGKKKIIDEQHQEVLEKIKEYNEFVRREKIKEIITTYELRLHQREQRIEGNEKLKEKEVDIEPLREERNKSVREHFKFIRNKLKSIYAKKDSEEKS